MKRKIVLVVSLVAGIAAAVLTRFYVASKDAEVAALKASFARRFGTIDVLLYGHFHIPTCEKVALGDGTFTALNPGSTSIPKNGSAHSCMVWEGEKVRWIDLESGDVFMGWDGE